MNKKPNFLYRGTTWKRMEKESTGNAGFPPNWTDDPLQGVSYALGHVLGNSEEDVPVIMVTEYAESYFEDSGGVANYFPRIPVVDDRAPDWYNHVADERFDTEKERDKALEIYDLDNIESFTQQYLTEETEEQRDAVENLFKQLTCFE